MVETWKNRSDIINLVITGNKISWGLMFDNNHLLFPIHNFLNNSDNLELLHNLLSFLTSESRARLWILTWYVRLNLLQLIWRKTETRSSIICGFQLKLLKRAAKGPQVLCQNLSKDVIINKKRMIGNKNVEWFDNHMHKIYNSNNRSLIPIDEVGCDHYKTDEESTCYWDHNRTHW